jgi:hypothetical protein
MIAMVWVRTRGSTMLSPWAKLSIPNCYPSENGYRPHGWGYWTYLVCLCRYTVVKGISSHLPRPCVRRSRVHGRATPLTVKGSSLRLDSMRRFALFSSCWPCVEYVDMLKISVKFAVLCLCEMCTDFDNVCDIGNIWIWFVNQCNPKLIYPAVFTHRAVLYSAYIRFFTYWGYVHKLTYIFVHRRWIIIFNFF